MAIDSKLYFHATMFASWRAGNANESRAQAGEAAQGWPDDPGKVYSRLSFGVICHNCGALWMLPPGLKRYALRREKIRSLTTLILRKP